MTVVTLHVRVWIEIQSPCWLHHVHQVTLHVRVWIEIMTRRYKFCVNTVTLHVRVWIEISLTSLHWAIRSRHPPREGVD